MELNSFVENYIKNNHSKLSDREKNEISHAIRAGYYFGKGDNEPVDETSFDFIVSIYDKAKTIHEAVDLDAEQKYDMIFHDDISKKVNHLFDYYDPDTSYEEDTYAFMRAFKEYIDELKITNKYKN